MTSHSGQVTLLLLVLLLMPMPVLMPFSSACDEFRRWRCVRRVSSAYEATLHFSLICAQETINNALHIFPASHKASQCSTGTVVTDLKQIETISIFSQLHKETGRSELLLHAASQRCRSMSVCFIENVNRDRVWQLSLIHI